MLQNIQNICETSKLPDNDRHIFHMILPISQCVAFFTEKKKGDGLIKAVGC